MDNTVKPHPSCKCLRPSTLVVLPVFNAETELAASVAQLRYFLDTTWSAETKILIADNGSTDLTASIGKRMAKEVNATEYRRFEIKGRGYALKAVWEEASEDILSYMDIDLSTELSCFPRLLESLVMGTHDLAVGSRHAQGAKVQRGFKRDLISRIYNHILRHTLKLPVADAQCGFKALTREAAHQLLPKIKNRNWFFDTEMLVLAKNFGMRVSEVPVVWTDRKTTTVKLIPTIKEDIAGIWRMRGSSNRTPKALKSNCPTPDTSVKVQQPSSVSGFTILELLTVIAIIFLLAGLVLGSVVSMKTRTKTIICRSNLRQLQIAYLLYGNEAEDFLPVNRSRLEMTSGKWVSATNSWCGPSNAQFEGDGDKLKLGSIYPYVKTTSIYRCPLDILQWQQKEYKTVKKARSYSINGSLNGNDGPNRLQSVIIKFSNALHPATTYCLIQEDPFTIDDGHFFVNQLNPDPLANRPSFVDRKRAAFAFLDGHVEQARVESPEDLARMSLP